MPMPDAAKNILADFAFRNTPSGMGTLYVSLHTADPGTTGASESGLGRVALGAAAPSAGATVASGTVTAEAGLAVSSITTVSPNVRFTIAGGLPGRVYGAQVLATLSTGAKIQQNIEIEVK